MKTKLKSFWSALLASMLAVVMSINSALFITPVQAADFSGYKFTFNGTWYQFNAAGTTATKVTASDAGPASMDFVDKHISTSYPNLMYCAAQKLVVIVPADNATLSEKVTGSIASTFTSSENNSVIYASTAKGANALQLAGQVFADMPALTKVELADTTAITGSMEKMFAKDTALTTITYSGTAVKPTNINNAFFNCKKLSLLPEGFDFSFVASANQAFAQSGLSVLDLSDMPILAEGSATNMLYKTKSLKEIHFSDSKFYPTDETGWTGRWAPSSSGTGAKLASAYMNQPISDPILYRMISTTMFEGAGLVSETYTATGLGINNMYALDDESAKFTAYCIEWNKDAPTTVPYKSYYSYTEMTNTDPSSLRDYLDIEGREQKGNPGEVITRQLANYDSNERDALRTLLYYGFPNDAGSIQDSVTGSTDLDFWAATQCAIWYAMSGVNFDNAFAELSDADAEHVIDPARKTVVKNLYDPLIAKTSAEYKAAMGRDSHGQRDIITYIYRADDATDQCMVSGTYTVEITKMDIVGSTELAGATLKVTDADGNVVDQWVSTLTPHTISGLFPGSEYTLTEITAPAGFAIAESITFTAGDISTYPNSEEPIKMYDDYGTHKITVKKLDDTSAYVVGATLQLTGVDYKGQTVGITKTTTSTDTYFEVLPGNYKITETKVPNGYIIADPISFEVKYSDNDNVKHIYTMTDKRLTYGTVTILKTGPDGKTAIEGAQLRIVDAAGNKIVGWTSDKKEYTIENKLVVGQKYKLQETDAPSGYEKASDIEFTPKEDETVKVVMKDKYKKCKLIIQKVDENGIRVGGAKLTITGQVLNGDNIDSITIETESGADKSVELYPGTYKIEETTVPYGYTAASAVSVKFAVNEGEKTIKMIDKTIANKDNPVNNAVNICKYEKDTKNFVSGAVLAIYDGSGKEVIKWTTGTQAYAATGLTKGQSYTLKEITAPTGYKKAADIPFTVTGSTQTIAMYDEKSSTAGAKAPRTGDLAPLEILGIIAGASVLGIVGFVVYRKKKKA